ncbi:Hypothetical protein, putative [Bodo saltans]|uniref:Uncharacterized protein n=1 Tax=Bodo saltans TaxID=75058 RepID=A0A0S4JGS6_BODSA|nr:Hypothetical protein, putative [Bodo saltans]|eukprot:CUG88425.1 Hypothetical protein, putative [Bodo saltans]
MAEATAARRRERAVPVLAWRRRLRLAALHEHAMSRRKERLQTFRKPANRLLLFSDFRGGHHSAATQGLCPSVKERGQSTAGDAEAVEMRSPPPPAARSLSPHLGNSSSSSIPLGASSSVLGQSVYHERYDVVGDGTIKEDCIKGKVRSRKANVIEPRTYSDVMDSEPEVSLGGSNNRRVEMKAEHPRADQQHNSYMLRWAHDAGHHSSHSGSGGRQHVVLAHSPSSVRFDNIWQEDRSGRRSSGGGGDTGDEVADDDLATSLL